MRLNNPYVIAFLVMVGLWLINSVLTRSFNPLKVVQGEDGRPSTSKLQIWLWTVVVLFSYVAIYAARVAAGQVDPINELPANILIALGLSVVTATAAKGITVSQLQSGDIVKPPPTRANSGPGDIVKEDDGSLDLSKIQMLMWTVIAIGVYLINVGVEIKAPPHDKLPDIDAALMVLMGLGQGAYLGKKLVSTDVPRITAVSSQSTNGASVITIQGDTFGQAQNGGIVTIDSLPMSAPITTWGDTQIVFNLPATHPNGKAWTPGQTILIGLVVNGHESVTRLPVTLA